MSSQHLGRLLQPLPGREAPFCLGVCLPGFTKEMWRTRLFAKSHTHTFLLYNILRIYTDVLGKLSLAQTSLQSECDFFFRAINQEWNQLDKKKKKTTHGLIKCTKEILE